LTNRAEFTGHSGLAGASGFLVRVPDGRVLGATAKHLIGEAGGVEPPVRLAELGGALKSWVMFPRTDKTKTVALDRAVIGAGDEDAHDWLLMALKATSDPLPAEPLPARETRVEVGESVYLIGVPYSEPRSPQNVYRGTVIARQGDYFRFTMNPHVELRGFSGAPIIDADGRAVGVLRGGYGGERGDGKDVEGGGEDVVTALRLLRG
jgi:hypothetical protein